MKTFIYTPADGKEHIGLSSEDCDPSVLSIKSTWYAIDGSNCVADCAVPRVACRVVSNDDGGSDDYWNAVAAFLKRHHYYCDGCRVGEGGTKAMCYIRPGLEHLAGVIPGCWDDHISRGVDPVCVDHG